MKPSDFNRFFVDELKVFSMTLEIDEELLIEWT